MSWQAVAWAQRMGDSHRLKPGPSFLLIVMGNYSDDDGNGIFPALETLCEKTRQSRNTVRTQLDMLETLGLIAPGDRTSAARRFDGDPKYMPTVWRLVMDEDERRSRGLSTPATRAASPGAKGGAHGGKRRQRVKNSPSENGEPRGSKNSAPEGQTGGQNLTPILKKLSEKQAASSADAVAEPETTERPAVPAAADTVALAAAVKARRGADREPVAVVDIDLGRQLRAQIAKRRTQAAKTGGRPGASAGTVSRLTASVPNV